MSKLKIFENIQHAFTIIPRGEIKKLKINGFHVCMAQVNGKLIAFETKCPHMDYPLVEGAINGMQQISCPWHGYRFSLLSGQEENNRCSSLDIFPITVNEKSEVFIEF